MYELCGDIDFFKMKALAHFIMVIWTFIGISLENV
ncbi:hypothetical protein YYY_01910 [Anaplasma phagocytophilum str. Dog2]|nr:hypothetical protein YYY_01910 [Anaplasma phagocytophilum str. Dog2]